MENLFWHLDNQLAACESCDGAFVLPAEAAAGMCPYCGSAGLQPLEAAAEPAVSMQPPELIVPASAPAAQLQEALRRFARGTWFAPADLTPEALQARLRLLYVPMWLVDAQARAQWQAEVGFDYQVVSHRERFANGQWQTEEVRETRVRWEPRVGTLTRPYANVPAPALDEHAQLERLLGQFDVAAATAYGAEAAVAVHLPNRPPADAWPDAQAALKTRAAAECRQAAAADHVREFRWAPEFDGQNWTLLLLPLYVTHYVDDDAQVRRVLLHGQTGALRGERRASLRQARRWSLALAGVAAVIFVLSVVAALVGRPDERWLSLAGGGLAAGLLLAGTAVLPLLVAWSVNVFGHFYDGGQQLMRELAAVAWQGRMGNG
ncbi:MAG: hypothetical protein KC425_27650 [Anaerolineales bacterium]|nr:hypothetical protein [Anaerolineales bacterium]